jgi:Xaa-Pro dipeptidase
VTLPFERHEYAERLARVRAAMRIAELDVLLVYHQEHMFYLTGYDQVGYWVYQVLIVPAGDVPIVALVRKVDELIVRESGIVGDVRVWFDDGAQNPASKTVELLQELALVNRRRVGVELKSHTLLPYYFETLRTGISRLGELVDASDLITELRLVKSPAEIGYMRRAGEIMDIGVRTAFDALRPGVRECDIQAALMHAMYHAGGELPSLTPPMGSGPRTLTQTHGAATTRVVQADDPFLLEVGGCSHRYHAVCIRSASVGSPSKTMQALYELLRDATEEGIQSIKPGMPTAQLASIVWDHMERRGHPRDGSHLGYGIGLGYPPTWLDNLRIKETDSHLLRPGTTFMLAAGLLDSESSLYVSIGDPILVTSTGHERLSTLSRELTVVGR